MKPKISPEEYRNILESLELENLYLNESNSKFNEEYLSSSLNLDIREKYKFEQTGNILKIKYNYKLNAKEDDAENAAITISAIYTVLYNLKKEVIVTDDFMKVFSDLTLGMLLWTYFRELISNTVYRMNLPPLILPLRKS